MAEKKKIMVTGAEGFLGSRLSAYYEKSQTVIQAGRGALDIESQEDVRRVFYREGPDIVLHCAAVSDVGRCGREKELSRRVNEVGTVHVAKACREFGSKLVFMSSDQVYMGNGRTSANREEDAGEPANTYSLHKRNAETAVRELLPDSVCLRLTWMYDLPARGMRTNRNLLCSLLDAAIRGVPLLLPVYDFRGITYVWEAVIRMEKAWDLPGGIYNFGSENEMNTYDLALNWLHKMGIDWENVAEADRQRFQDNPRNLKINTRKIKDQGIGFPDSSEGIERCLKDYGLER